MKTAEVVVEYVFRIKNNYNAILRVLFSLVILTWETKAANETLATEISLMGKPIIVARKPKWDKEKRKRRSDCLFTMLLNNLNEVPSK